MPELDRLTAIGLARYPSNAAAIPMPAGAKRAGELNDRAKKEQDLGPQAFDLLRRIHRADQHGDFNLVGVLIVEARGLIVDAGGAL